MLHVNTANWVRIRLGAYDTRPSNIIHFIGYIGVRKIILRWLVRIFLFLLLLLLLFLFLSLLESLLLGRPQFRAKWLFRARDCIAQSRDSAISLTFSNLVFRQVFLVLSIGPQVNTIFFLLLCISLLSSLLPCFKWARRRRSEHGNADVRAFLALLDSTLALLDPLWEVFLVSYCGWRSFLKVSIVARVVLTGAFGPIWVRVSLLLLLLEWRRCFFDLSVWFGSYRLNIHHLYLWQIILFLFNLIARIIQNLLILFFWSTFGHEVCFDLLFFFFWSRPCSYSWSLLFVFLAKMTRLIIFILWSWCLLDICIKRGLRDLLT